MTQVDLSCATKGPKPGSAADKIVRAIYERGPMTTDELISVTGMMLARRNGYTSALRRCVDYGWLELGAGAKYSLTPVVLGLLAREVPEPVKYEGAVAGPRYHKEFTPIQAKNIPSLEPRRPDALPARRVSFVSCSGAPSQVWG